MQQTPFMKGRLLVKETFDSVVSLLFDDTGKQVCSSHPNGVTYFKGGGISPLHNENRAR